MIGGSLYKTRKKQLVEYRLAQLTDFWGASFGTSAIAMQFCFSISTPHQERGVMNVNTQLDQGGGNGTSDLTGGVHESENDSIWPGTLGFSRKGGSDRVCRINDEGPSCDLQALWQTFL